MRCTRCSKDSEFDAAYCRFCGAPLGVQSTQTRRLTRLPQQGQLAGVCAGLAAYLNIDVTIVRLLWVIFSIVPGAVIGGVIAYIAACLLIPAAHDAVVETPVDRLYRSINDRQIAGVCGGLAAYLHVDSTLVRLAFVVLSIYPGAIIFGVIAYIIGWAVIPLGPSVQSQSVAA